MSSRCLVEEASTTLNGQVSFVESFGMSRRMVILRSRYFSLGRYSLLTASGRTTSTVCPGAAFGDCAPASMRIRALALLGVTLISVFGFSVVTVLLLSSFLPSSVVVVLAAFAVSSAAACVAGAASVCVFSAAGVLSVFSATGAASVCAAASTG